MSDEREVIGAGHKLITDEEFANLTADQLAHRFVEIADRGLVNMRLTVPLPADTHGEWAPNDSASIASYMMKGFRVDDTYAPKYTLHSDASGKAIVGDAIHMICPKRVKEALDKAERIIYDRNYGKPRTSIDEAQAESTLKELGLPTDFKGQDINTSRTDAVNSQSIASAIAGG